MNKICPSLEAALADVADGASIMIGGFGDAGVPFEMIDALVAQGAKDLTIISNNAGTGEAGIAALIKRDRVKKIVCSFPRQTNSAEFDKRYLSGELILDLVPQGNLAERIRAAGAGIGAFFTPTAYGTLLAEGKETREINGRQYVLEHPIFADYAFIKAPRATRSATSSIARPHAISVRSWRPPPNAPSRRSRKWSASATSIPRRS